MTQELKVVLGIGIASMVIIFGAIFFLSNKNESSTVLGLSDNAILMRNSKHSIPADNAKVTIVEFADFQCPACGRTYPVLKQVLAEYKGKITFIYRHFPLPQHSNAMLAAQASEAASAQGKFWEMYSMLYENQTTWSESLTASEIFTGYAKKLGLDTQQFSQDLSNASFEKSIQSDKDDGIRLGVNSTPTFFINNKKLEESPTYSVFKSTIDKALSAQ